MPPCHGQPNFSPPAVCHCGPDGEVPGNEGMVDVPKNVGRIIVGGCCLVKLQGVAVAKGAVARLKGIVEALNAAPGFLSRPNRMRH